MEGVKVESRTTVTTSTTTTNGPVVNYLYFKTIPGILKLLEIIFGVFCVGLASDAVFAASHFFLFVCWTAMILTIIWIILILLRLNEKITLHMAWVKIELWCTVGVAFFYFLAMILQLTKFSGLHSPGSTYVGRHQAAAVFAVFNTIAYAAGAVLLFRG